jgi:CheY-like chemotaxis protein
MDAETLERIFDPYFTTKEVGKGTGLGLAMAHGIVNRHEGAIIAHSEPGKGATFHVYLPRTETRAVPEDEAPEPLPQGTERILFIDDEEALAELGKTRLQVLGYEVLAQTNPVQALEHFRTQPERFDLVISDYTMPQMTGVDLAKEMRRIRPDVRVILCTGFTEKITEEKAMAMGIYALRMKPLSMRDLAETVRSVLDRGNKDFCYASP